MRSLNELTVVLRKVSHLPYPGPPLTNFEDELVEILREALHLHYETCLDSIAQTEDVRAYMEGAASRLMIEEGRLKPFSDTVLTEMVSK